MTRKTLLTLGGLLAFLPASLGAQTSTTIPPGMDKTEGQMWVNAPLVLTPARIQCGYDASASGWKTSKKISENHGTDKTIFMKQKNYAFPTFGGSVSGPQPWMISLKGDKPFVATTARLIVDWATFTDSKNTTRSNYSFTIDAAVAKGYTNGTRGSYSGYGRPCWIQYFQVGASGVNTTDAMFRTFGHTGGTGNFVLGWLGTKKLSVAIPGIWNCYLLTEFAVFHPSIPRTTSTGIATFEWGKVPTAMVKKTIYSQMAAISPKGKLGFSKGLSVTFGDRKWVRNWDAAYLMMYGQSGIYGFDPRKDLGRFHGDGVVPVFDIR